jgi:hypothetical protein
VPAGEGLLLKGADNTYTIPVCATTPDPIENAFIGVINETTVSGAGIFVLMNGAKGIGFYKTTAESFTVGANTAYLPANIVPAARTFIGFDNETTGISDTLNDKGQRTNDKNIAGFIEACDAFLVYYSGCQSPQ